MLNTSKLLYILPDLAYIAELLPGKKEHQYKVQSFRQINGEFIDDNLLIHENIEKLVKKIDEETYNLVLPDFLFTNAIVEINETSKAKIEDHINKELLPSLDLDPETHQINHFVLNTHNKKSRIQICALEKSILEPFRTAAKDKNIEIEDVLPLSWTIKASISLEPSISILQIGEMLYLALHYIGIDQTISFGIDKVENIVETIKTLKGGLPSIQTLYLLTNQLVEEELKELLSDTLPIQQLASFAHEEKDLPSYVKQIIETTQKTLSIKDFPTPKFEIGKPGETKMPNTKIDKDEIKNQDSIAKLQNDSEQETDSATPDTDTNDENLESEDEKETEESDNTTPASDTNDEQEIPKPTLPIVGEEVEDLETTKSEEKDSITSLQNDSEQDSDNKPQSTEDKKELAEIPLKDTKENTKPEKTDESEDNNSIALLQNDKEEKNNDSKQEAGNSQQVTEEEPDLHQFAANNETDTMPSQASLTNTKREVIKNQNPNKTMIRMIFITLAVLFVTVGVGVGLGLGFLTISNRNQADTTPIVEVSEAPESMPEPTMEPEPSPTPEPVDVANLDVLVVNATTTAGKAGEYKTILTDNDFENVDAGNAKGDYEPGTYVLMETESPAIMAAVEEALDLVVTYSEKVSIEDPDSDYDFVLVIGE